MRSNHADFEKRIEITYEKKEDSVRVCVFNTGNPIPEEDLPNIWDKFYKVDKARTREYGGSGIGLSIVKAIMESHHRECGAKPYDLSSEEQEKVAAYAAHVVTRYNDRQDEGLIKIQQEDFSEDTADSKTTQTDTKDKQETSGDSAKNTTAETESQKQRQYLCDRH